MKPDISSNATFAAVVHNELEREKKSAIQSDNFRIFAFGNFRVAVMFDLKFFQKTQILALDFKACFKVHN